MISLSQIKSNPKNPRAIKDNKFKQLVQSIKDFPEMLSKRKLVCVTDTDGKIMPLGGNMRYLALKEIGYAEIPCDWVEMADDWTEEQRRQFMIKDNVSFGEWDFEDLANNWEAQELKEWGLDLPVFDQENQDNVILKAEEDDYEVPNENSIKTDIVLGDLFEIGEHRLLCGDSTDSDQVAKLMNGQKADMVFTDPPYGDNHAGMTWKNGKVIKAEKIKNDINIDFLEDVFNNAIIFLKENFSAIVFFKWNHWEKIKKYTKSFGEPKTCIVWDRDEIAAANFRFNPCHEFAFYFGTQGDKKTTSNLKNVWRAKKEDGSKELHPTVKPQEIIIPALEVCTEKNEIILDLFLGSGSTMVASHQLKRKCYGMELDPKYCQVIIDRMKKLDPSLVIKKNGVELK